MTDFAVYLKEAREDAGFNQVELAEKVGLTGSYISILENRKKPPPSDAVLEKLARALRRPLSEILEVAHLDRAPDDIRKKIRALDRRLRVERKVTKRLLTDLLPSSLWHFWRVRGFHEYGLEKVRLDARKRGILREVLRRIGHLTRRDDFVTESRRVIEGLTEEERTILAEVLPELVPPEEVEIEAPPIALAVPVVTRPLRRAATRPSRTLPVSSEQFGPDRYFLVARDAEMLPRIEEGDMLLIDPHADPAAGALALVTIKGRWTFREVMPGGKDLLFAAAATKVVPVKGRKDDVLGVVVEIRRSLA